MKKSIDISRKEQKTVDLYLFYKDNGFNHTIDEIASAMKIGRKTFYNRYVNKETSVSTTLQYCHAQFVDYFNEQLLQCNHSVEEVVLLMWEFRQFAHENRVFFQYDWDNGLFFTDETPFRSLLVSIIRKGLRSYHIREDIDATAYANFFYANLSLYVLSGHTQSVILRYVLMPLLNERGMELLDELNLESFA